MMEWKEHSGGKCPADALRKIVAVKMRGGHENPPMPAQQIRWEHLGLDHDTVAYRLEHTQANYDIHKPYDATLLPPDSHV